MLYPVEIRHDHWKRLVENHPDATIFHHHLWSELLSDCYGYKPFVILFESDDGKISGGLPVMEINSRLTGKRWVALPFTDHCKPLLEGFEDYDTFLNQLTNLNETAECDIEIRYGKIFEGTDKAKTFYLHHLVLCEDPGLLYKNFRKKGVQYCIKKANKNGISVTFQKDLEAVLTFYKLHLMTRKKLGVPTQPRKYFIKLWEYLLAQKHGFVALARYQNQPVAAGVFLYYRNKIVYKYGATDPNYMSLYANHALLWEVIQWACKNKFTLFDWGRTDKINNGLRNFKLGWGSSETELCYSHMGTISEDFSKGWKNDFLKQIVKRSPTFVGRILGQLLYRHVG